MCTVFANIICLYPIVLHVKVNGDPVKRLRKKLMITPNYTLGDAMIDDRLDFETFVVFFKDEIVHPDTLIRTLLGKTTPINHLSVVSKISESYDSHE